MVRSRDEIVEEILRRQLTGIGERSVSASQVAKYVSAPFALHCDVFGPAEEREQDSEFMKMLKQRGITHELAMIQGEVEPAEWQTWEEGFRHTIEHMADGAPGLYNMPLISDPAGMIGVPDQLLRVDGQTSLFGHFAYRVVEVKSRKTLTYADKVQAAFYNRLLGLIQGSTPSEFFLKNSLGKDKSEQYMRWDSLLDGLIRGARQVVAGEHIPDPIYGRTPGPWRSYENKMARGDVSRLWQIGPERRAVLLGQGLNSIGDVALADESDVAGVLGTYVARSIIPHARALCENNTIAKRPVAVPESEVEVFLDMENINEGIGAEFTIYLIGALVRSEEGECYHSFFAETPDEEEMRWREFSELMAATETPAIYYWSASAEKVYIRKMVAKHQTAGRIQDKLAAAMDLYRITSDAYAFPIDGYRLKEIAGYLGYRWQVEDRDGLWAMIAYLDYQAERTPQLREEILTYNEDDCRALMHVKDWLVANSALRIGTRPT